MGTHWHLHPTLFVASVNYFCDMTTVNLKEARELIRTCGTTNTFIFQGEPGAGKSAMLQTLAEQTALEPRYIDCALFDLGDLQMPRVGDAVEFVPNQMFVGNKPLIVMLDEIGKAMRPVQNALLTLLLEHRIGNHPDLAQQEWTSDYAET